MRRLLARREPYAAGTPRPDRTGTIIVAITGTVLTGLVIFGGTVEVIRSLEESRIEDTYNVKITDGIRDGRFTVVGWGVERDCMAPTSEADYERPVQCRTAVFETVQIPPVGK